MCKVCQGPQEKGKTHHSLQCPDYIENATNTCSNDRTYPDMAADTPETPEEQYSLMLDAAAFFLRGNPGAGEEVEIHYDEGGKAKFHEKSRIGTRLLAAIGNSTRREPDDTIATQVLTSVVNSDF